MRAEPVADRLWRRVDKSGECWIWTGTKWPSGYGLIRLSRPKRTNGLTHRVAWEVVNGPIPPGIQVLHRCDVRDCVRPDHLFLGTNADNMADKKAKGRSADMRGTRNPRAKLTPEDVATIRALYVSAPTGRPPKGVINPTRALAERFGVSVSTVKWIAAGRSWQD